MQGSQAIALSEGKLHALSHPYLLDGRVSTHPRAAAGTATMNSYLLTEGRSALLIDAGMTAHEVAITERLAELLSEGDSLSILPTRVSEFGPICAARTIAARFKVDRIFGTIGDPLEWVDFRPPSTPQADPPHGKWTSAIRGCRVSSGDAIDVGPDGRRRLELLSPPLRLLPSLWAYDAATRTLFTADMFSHLTLELTEGRTAVGLATELPGTQVVYDHLVGGRYWWLAGARSEPIREGLRQLFDAYPVDVIAPAFGAISTGTAVARQYEQLLEVLELAGRAMPPAHQVAAR